MTERTMCGCEKNPGKGNFSGWRSVKRKCCRESRWGKVHSNAFHRHETSQARLKMIITLISHVLMNPVKRERRLEKSLNLRHENFTCQKINPPPPSSANSQPSFAVIIVMKCAAPRIFSDIKKMSHCYLLRC
jgi:hypothetical protein